MAEPPHECTCSAFFPTIDALKSHVAEYQSYVENLKRIIDKCKDHSAVDEQSDRTTADRTTAPRHCPYNRCKRTEAFTKRKELRTHFRKHVGCNEVCLCCAGIFRWASDFLRHAPNADKMDGMQCTFMHSRRQIVVETVDQQLEALEGKRKRDGDEDEDTGKRIKTDTSVALEKAELDLTLGAPVHDTINFTPVQATTGARLGAPIHSTINFTSFGPGQDVGSDLNLGASVHNAINFASTGTATEAELDLIWMPGAYEQTQ
ncbi:hypothetical protein B0T14DRAFT_127257 [Immersiella caudata]|uniref:Uncharacterized protein n=1 Tax=Immersiella caudata TaxID=314043 RepID=A0AA40C6A1_9PEZI|nr:hypothetical protein B0T14DRAFT_127257 [Immersiella caudata]